MEQVPGVGSNQVPGSCSSGAGLVLTGYSLLGLRPACLTGSLVSHSRAAP